MQKICNGQVTEYLSDDQIAEVAESVVKGHIKDTMTMITGESTI